MTDTPFCIRFSDITIRFVPCAPIGLPDEFRPFLCEDPGVVDAEYRLRMLYQPLQPEGPSSTDGRGTMIYKTEAGWLRVYPLYRPDDGCQVACLLAPDNVNTLYYPAALWDHYTSILHCIHLIGVERLLLARDAFLLHSSIVSIHGKAVLFSGPSGAGKSTQAALWREHLGADILNGDRCVVMKKDGDFYGGGSPMAGCSGIFRPEQMPIAGIFILNKAPGNMVRPAGFRAFIPLFSQTLLNSWDQDFMDKLSSLFQDLLDQVPVYFLDCKPDEEAVDLAYRTLFRKGPSNT